MFLSTTALIDRTIRRLRMVAGNSTQLYAQDVVGEMLQETYQMVRSHRWWDHLMKWHTSQLDGTTGKFVTTVSGAAERMRDVRNVYYGNQDIPMPQLPQFLNPYRITGTHPRFYEPLNMADDADGLYLLRIWPLASVTDADHPIRIHYRADPANVFDDPDIIVPFDATCLINGAAFKYAADDGANPASVATLQSAFEARLKQLTTQHDSAPLLLDTRQVTPAYLTEWSESYP